MSPEQRLAKAFELSDYSKKLFVRGLRKKYPDVSAEEFVHILNDGLNKCHNRNY